MRARPLSLVWCCVVLLRSCTASAYRGSPGAAPSIGLLGRREPRQNPIVPNRAPVQLLTAGRQSTGSALREGWVLCVESQGRYTVYYIVINFSRGGRLSRSSFQHGAAAGIVLRQVQELGPPGIRRVCAQRKCTRVRGSAGCLIQRSPGGWRWSLISACEACTWVLRPLRG